MKFVTTPKQNYIVLQISHFYVSKHLHIIFRTVFDPLEFYWAFIKIKKILYVAIGELVIPPLPPVGNLELVDLITSPLF